MTAPTLVLTSTPDGPGPGPGAGPFARAVAAVPPPGLLLVSIVSIQLGAAVAVHPSWQPAAWSGSTSRCWPGRWRWQSSPPPCRCRSSSRR